MKADLAELLEEMREPAAASDMPPAWEHPSIQVLLLHAQIDIWGRPGQGWVGHPVA